MRNWIDLLEHSSVVEWAEMTGHELRERMTGNPDNFNFQFVRGSKLRDEHHLTAWVDDILVADAELQQSPYDPDEMWFMHVAVAPAYQGRGFGRVLCNWGFRTTRAMGKKILTLSSFTDEGENRLNDQLRKLAREYDDLDVHFNSDGPRRAIKEGEEPLDFKAFLTITDSYKGEAFGYCQAHIGDEAIGYLNFSIYDGEADVKMIEVNEKYRRKGVAKKLLDLLAAEVKGKQNINWGYHTDDGAALHAAYDADI